MDQVHRLLSGSISAIPAIILGICLLTISRNEYYWSTYAITTLIYFGASLFLGLILPARMYKTHIRYPWLWLFISGGFAWVIALLSLALLNLTPLCVGQDNGDGINTYSLCILYSVLVTLIYSPSVLILLTLSAFIGGNIIRTLIRAREKQSSQDFIR